MMTASEKIFNHINIVKNDHFQSVYVKIHWRKQQAIIFILTYRQPFYHIYPQILFRIINLMKDKGDISSRPFEQQMSTSYQPFSKNKVDKDSHQKLLQKQSPPRYSFQVEHKKIDFQTNIQKKDLEYNPYQADQYREQDYCYPKFLSCIGSWCIPLKIFLPCCFCNCCLCSTDPVFRQEMISLGLLQQWGRFSKVLTPGLHIINPISQSIIEMNQQTKILQYTQNIISRDNVQSIVDIVIFYRIVDSIKCAYRLGNYDIVQCIKEIAMGILRQICGQNILQNIIDQRNLITEKFTKEINMQIQYWGLYVEISSLKQIKIDKQIQRCLQMVTQTKRLSEAMIINYRAQVQCGKLIKQISEIINNKASYQIRYFNLVEEILSKGTDNVVIIRTSLKDVNQ